MSFETLAPHYTWMETVLAGSRLQRARLTWLDAVAGSREILIAGVGHGHFLKRCATRFPHARITSVDASAGMLLRARRRVERAGVTSDRLAFVQALLPAWEPPAGSFDAIVTHFFLDCFSPGELPVVVSALARTARPDARWLVSDFAVPAAGLARQRARAIHALMYAFFRRVTRIRARRVTEPDRWLRAAGFALAGRTTSEWGLLRADCWERRSAAPAGAFAVE